MAEKWANGGIDRKFCHWHAVSNWQQTWSGWHTNYIIGWELRAEIYNVKIFIHQ